MGDFYDQLLISSGDEPDIYQLAISGDSEFESDAEFEDQSPTKYKSRSRARSRPEAGQGHMPDTDDDDTLSRFTDSESDIEQIFRSNNNALPGAEMVNDQPEVFSDDKSCSSSASAPESQESVNDDTDEVFYGSEATMPSFSYAQDSDIDEICYNDWSEDSFVRGSGVQLDPDTGIVQDETGDWIAYRTEPRRLTYVPFKVHCDGEPQVVTIQEPLEFTKTWNYNQDVYMTKIHVTNIARHGISYMVCPSDPRKLTVDNSQGIIEYGKSDTITVYSTPDSRYTFGDILKSHIMFYAAPVKISTNTGSRNYGWDKIGEQHYADFWSSYGSAWFPRAEVTKLDFQTAMKEPLYVNEPNRKFFPRWMYDAIRVVRRSVRYISSFQQDLEDEMNFLVHKGCTVVYPDGTNRKEIVKPYVMSKFEKRLLALDTDEDYFSFERTVKKLVKFLLALSVLLIVICLVTDERFPNYMVYLKAVYEECNGLKAKAPRKGYT